MKTKWMIGVLGAVLLALGGCKDDKLDGPGNPEYKGTVTLVSTTLTDNYQWGGGNIRMKVESGNEGGKWQGRIVVDGIPGEPMDFDGEEVIITIPQNRSEDNVTVSIEAMSEESWTELIKRTQLPGATKVGSHIWAKGNLTVLKEEFAFAPETEYGMYFYHLGHYAVPGVSYQYPGIVYTPEETTMEWTSVTTRTGKDPCRLVKPENTWFTPDRDMLVDLMYMAEDFGAYKGVKGLFFDTDRLFLPSAGTRMNENGNLISTTTHGGYWGRGADEEGYGEIMVFAPEYEEFSIFISNALENPLTTIRCVKQDGYADLVSFSPAQGASGGFELTVTASGTKASFRIGVEAGYDFFDEIEVTDANPVAVFNIPENENIEPRNINIYVDNTFTCQYATQSGIAGYSFYKSHTPSGTVGGDAFDLNVTCLSDMESFEVVVYTDDNSVNVTATGSKDNLTVAVPVPANHSGSSRTLKIKVNGEDTGKKVIQEYRPETYGEVVLANVTWAKGNLILKNGTFEIGEPADYGLYFMKNSIYGIASDKESFDGTVYSPAASSVAWGSILYNDGGDPCKLVSPADSWRTPSEAELEILHGTAGSLYTLNGIKGRHYSGNEMFVPASGMIQNGTRTPQGTYGYLRSSSANILSYSSQAHFGNGMDDMGYPVRCVKRQNYADYVSHTPTEDQPGDAFMLTVTCVSDLAAFPVRVTGGSVDLTMNGTSGSPVVMFSIPANETPQDRELTIYVNGMNTGKTVKQASKQGLSVEWSSGYVTVKDGAYAFAGPQEKGMYFKYKSRYAIPGDTNYQGKVYGPQEVSTYATHNDIPYDEVDPCSLVEPGNNWRMPTQAEFQELMDNATFSATSTYLKYTLDSEEVYFAGPNGSIIASGRLSYSDSAIFIRTSTESTTDKYYYFYSKMDAISTKVTGSLAGNVSMMIRCVRSK